VLWDEPHRVYREPPGPLLGEEGLDLRAVELADPNRPQGGDKVILEFFPIAGEAPWLKVPAELQPPLEE
jgi:hypothetical protein